MVWHGASGTLLIDLVVCHVCAGVVPSVVFSLVLLNNVLSWKGEGVHRFVLCKYFFFCLVVADC